MKHPATAARDATRAFAAIVERLGAKIVADTLGVSPERVYQMAAGRSGRRDYPPPRVTALQQLRTAGATAGEIAGLIDAREMGLVVVETASPTVSTADLRSSMCRITARVGRAAGALEAAVADGRHTPDEDASIQRELDGLQSEIEALRQRSRAAVAGDVAELVKPLVCKRA